MCWHKWEKWEVITLVRITEQGQVKYNVLAQQRKCKKCGLIQTRILGA